ncbi:hypothetical protein [Clostridium gasigenes]|uniref:hypothetical protein n=1 Tax=Clostridium gasigenes TaxID=94869 RepID=UPI001C0C309E|nr:hypothetical protein [Clostridium gasigenes]MBU3106700.1 hypothetical protein [Clostridium gasigenes]
MKLSDLIAKLLKKEVGLDLNNPEHLNLVKKIKLPYYIQADYHSELLIAREHRL